MAGLGGFPTMGRGRAASSRSSVVAPMMSEDMDRGVSDSDFLLMEAPRPARWRARAVRLAVLAVACTVPTLLLLRDSSASSDAGTGGNPSDEDPAYVAQDNAFTSALGAQLTSAQTMMTPDRCQLDHGRKSCDPQPALVLNRTTTMSDALGSLIDDSWPQAGGMLIHDSKVSVVEPPNQGSRSYVSITGTTSYAGQNDVVVDGRMDHNRGETRLLVYLQPASPDKPFTLQSITADDPTTSTILQQNVPISATTVVLTSFPQPVTDKTGTGSGTTSKATPSTPMHGVGLSLEALVHLNATNSDARLKRAAELVNKAVGLIWGKLDKNFKLDVPLPDVSLGNTLAMVNTTITVEKQEPVIKVGSSLVLTLPKASPAVMTCTVDFDHTKKQATLDGILARPWHFPGFVSDTRLSLTSMSSQLLVQLPKPRVTEGDVSMMFTYGSASLSATLSYPEADTVRSAVLELTVAGTTPSAASTIAPLPDLPMIDSSTGFPSLSGGKLGLILASEAEPSPHCWVSAVAPAPSCVPVAAGVNLYAEVDFAASASSLALPATAAGASSDSPVVLLSATYHSSRGLNATMDVPHTLTLTPSTVLDTAALSITNVGNPSNPVSMSITSELYTTLGSSTTLSFTVSGSLAGATHKWTLHGAAKETTTETTKDAQLPVVGSGVADLTAGDVDLTWDNQAKIAEVAIQLSGHLGTVPVEASVSGSWGVSDGVDQCWNAEAHTQAPISLLSWTEAIVGRPVVHDTDSALAKTIEKDVLEVLDLAANTLQIQWKPFCHEGSFDATLSEVPVFGTSEVQAQYARYLPAYIAVQAFGAQSGSAGSTSSNLVVASQFALLNAAVPVLRASNVTIPDPFHPKPVVSNLLLPVKEACDALASQPETTDSDKSALRNAVSAVGKIVAALNGTDPTIGSAGASMIEAAMKGQVVLRITPAEHGPGASFVIGGGGQGPKSFIPDTVEALQVHDAALTVASSAHVVSRALTKKNARLTKKDGVVASPVSSVVFGKGLTFSFTLKPTSSSTDAADRVLHWLMPDVQQLDLSGVVTDKTHWKLTGSIPGVTAELGDHADLSNAMMVLQADASPHLSLQATVDVRPANARSTTPAHSFTAKGTFDGPLDFSLSATSDGVWSIPAGPTNKLDLSKLTLSVQLSHPAPAHSLAWSISVGGEMAWATSLLDASLSASSTAAGGPDMLFTASVREEPPLKVGDALVAMCSGVPVVESTAEVVQPMLDGVAMVGAALTVGLAQGEDKLTFSGHATAFGGEVDFEATAAQEATADGSAQWGYLLGLAWGVPKPFSHIAPSVTMLDDWQFGPPALVLASKTQDATFTFPELNRPAATYHVERGLSLFASLSINQESSAMHWVSEWTKIDEVAANMHLSSLKDFDVKAELEGHLNVMPLTTLTELGFVVQVHPAEVSVGIEATATVAPHQGGELQLHGMMLAGDLGVTAQFNSLAPWEDVCGVHGVSVSQSDLEAEVSYEMVPLSFGVAGGMHFGAIGGMLALHVDVTTEDYAFMASVDDCVLNDMVNACCSDMGLPTDGVSQSLLQTGVEHAAMYVNPATQDVEFDGFLFRPGTIVQVRELLILDVINASGNVYITDAGVSADGSCQPFKLGDFLEVGGFDQSNGTPDLSQPASFALKLLKDQPPLWSVDAAVDLFGITVGCYVDIRDTGMTLDVGFVADLFNMSIMATEEGPLAHPTDFSVSATVNNEVEDYLKARLPVLIEQAKTSVSNRSDAITSEIQSWQDQVNTLQGQIDTRRAAVYKEQSKEQAALTAAQESVSDATAHVNALQAKVDELSHDISHLHWYESYKAVPWGVELAAIEAAKLVADGALATANAALEAAKAAVSIEHDLDPELDGLIAAKATATAALQGLQAVVDASESFVQNILNFVEESQSKAIDLFDPRSVQLSGSLKQLKQSDLGHISVDGYFVSTHVSFSVEANLSLADRLAHSIWTWLANRFDMAPDSTDDTTMLQGQQGSTRSPSFGAFETTKQLAAPHEDVPLLRVRRPSFAGFVVAN